MQITGTYRITGSTKLCPNVRSNTADAVKFLCVLKMCVLNNMNVFAIRWDDHCEHLRADSSRMVI